MDRPPPARLCRLLLVALALAAATVTARAADLIVSAAASLTNAFKDLAPQFEAAHPGTRLQFNFAASSPLLQQILKGAPVDVLATADQETMDQAQAQGLVQATQRRNVVSNSLVLVVPAASTQAPFRLESLASPAWQRIAIGLPASVPAGRYTKAALEAVGLWTAVEPKLIGTQNVRQALDFVARQEVDAGFVYATDAALMPDKVKIALTVATRMPILYPAAPIRGGPNPAAARAFVDFLTTPPAQAVLARHGFGKP